MSVPQSAYNQYPIQASQTLEDSKVDRTMNQFSAEFHTELQGKAGPAHHMQHHTRNARDAILTQSGLDSSTFNFIGQKKRDSLMNVSKPSSHMDFDHSADMQVHLATQNQLPGFSAYSKNAIEKNSKTLPT